jgi:hypothetical protein
MGRYGNSGSADSFHVSTRCGLSPKARQIRDTDNCDSPVSPAIDLVDQCVSCPGPFPVRPFIRLSANRTRHLRTDSGDTPV